MEAIKYCAEPYFQNTGNLLRIASKYFPGMHYTRNHSVSDTPKPAGKCILIHHFPMTCSRQWKNGEITSRTGIPDNNRSGTTSNSGKKILTLVHRPDPDQVPDQDPDEDPDRARELNKHWCKVHPYLTVLKYSLLKSFDCIKVNITLCTGLIN